MAGPLPPELDPEAIRRLQGLRDSILTNATAPHDVAPEFIIPGLKSDEFFDPGDFAGVADIELSTDAIREEFLALTRAKAPQLEPFIGGLTDAQPDSRILGKWSMIPLVKAGKVIEEYASLCPVTMTAFERLDAPRIDLISPSYYFSILEPHSRIEPHTGIINARLIVHWPLIVPQSCGLRVGTERREWVPGRALVFDDMIEHEAWNASDRIRVVLIGDLWRPEISQAERREITRLMSRSAAAA